MPHHFTKNTVEASFYCAPCGKDTPHRVDSGRRGPCLTCLGKPAKDEEFEERAAIIEFCGNVPRADAERIAADQIRDAKLKRQWKVEQGELLSVWGGQ